MRLLMLDLQGYVLFFVDFNASRLELEVAHLHLSVQLGRNDLRLY